MSTLFFVIAGVTYLKQLHSRTRSHGREICFSHVAFSFACRQILHWGRTGDKRYDGRGHLFRAFFRPTVWSTAGEKKDVYQSQLKCILRVYDRPNRLAQGTPISMTILEVRLRMLTMKCLFATTKKRHTRAVNNLLNRFHICSTQSYSWEAGPSFVTETVSNPSLLQ